jgi:hypothetical protein
VPSIRVARVTHLSQDRNKTLHRGLPPQRESHNRISQTVIRNNYFTYMRFP